jgi:hypothetical protein
MCRHEYELSLLTHYCMSILWKTAVFIEKPTVTSSDSYKMSRVVLFVMLIVHFAVHCSCFSRGKSILNVRACIVYRLSPCLLLYCIGWFHNVRLLAETHGNSRNNSICLYLVQFCELFLYVQSCCTLYEKVLRESFRLVFDISFLPNSRELSFSTSL